MDTERLWQVKVGLGRAPPDSALGEQRSNWLSEEELDGVGECGEEAVEEEDKEEGKPSETLVHELW